MNIAGIAVNNPFFLAPMAGIADSAFRHICKTCGAGLVYSEMISARALHYQDKKTLELLEFTGTERPIVFQIFGNEPDLMAEAAKKLLKWRPDAIDINMGCPTPKIVSNGDGAALMKDESLALAVCHAVASAVDVPVSVKFRLGWDDASVNAVSFARAMEQGGAAFVCVHGRTRAQFYNPHVDYQAIARVKQSVRIPVIANGGIFSAEQANRVLHDTGCDAVMIARGAMGNPYIFEEADAIYRQEPRQPHSTSDRLRISLEHVRLVCAYKGERVGIPEFRKHISCYLKGLRSASALKNEANRLTTLESLNQLIEYAIHISDDA